jgi:hypothetical protein
MPAQTVYYEEELPADFWDREGAPVDDSVEHKAAAPESDYRANGNHQQATNPTSLQQDPRFVTLTQLFPGKIIDWQLQNDTKNTKDSNDYDTTDAEDTLADLPESDITNDETADALD